MSRSEVLFALQVVGVGVGATLVMDLWNLFLKRVFGIPSLDFCLLGRWIGHMPSGTFRHASIAKSPAKPYECAVGWSAHYAIGVTMAAAFVLGTGDWLSSPSLLPALAFGVATVVLPYFVLQPALGFGVASARAANPTAARLKSLATHTVFGVGLYLAAVAVGDRDLQGAATSAAIAPSPTPAVEGVGSTPVSAPGFLYGRVTSVDGGVYEGRLQFGGDQEAFWGDYFNGAKKENPWVAHVPPERLRLPGRPIEIFGLDFGSGGTVVEVGRQLMARFGEIARIESRGRDVRVTLKSGTVVEVDRFEASDFDDGLRIWDVERGVVDLDSLRIRTIELLPTPPLAAAPERLHGTVRTRQGEFTGFVAWHQQAVLGADELEGRSDEGRARLRFDTLRSIERDAAGGFRMTLADGRELVLSDTDEVGDGNRGISVDDRRYGRVQIDWEAFERIDFDPPGREGSGPAYDDFPPGRPLVGRVTDRSGRVLAGRLVYDLDESETTDTLDVRDREVHYTIPFGRIAAIVPGDPDEDAEDGDDEDDEDDLGFSRVILHGGEELRLERTGDLGDGKAGLLVFVPGAPHPEHLPWTDLARLDLDPPPPAEPPGGGGEPLR